MKNKLIVAPHAGARIETCFGNHWRSAERSLPTRERELKLITGKPGSFKTLSLPTRERELKPHFGRYVGAIGSRSPRGSAN